MISVAIDGPAGAGKSTIARKLSECFGFIYVDTGALYRTIALNILSHAIKPEEHAKIAALLKDTKIDIVFLQGEQRVLLNGNDVSDKIRTPEVSMMASTSSALPQVRAFLLEIQRELARKNNVVMDGRDIGTVVLPDANIKIFLTADPEIRARRRYDEMIDKGMDVSFDEVLQDMITRDHNDSTRAVAPLKPAEDSILANTSGCTLEESIEMLVNIVRDRI